MTDPRSGVLRPAAAAAATASPPVALITGANRGIGLALSTVLAQEGWRVMATCRDPEHADELKELSAKHSGVTIDRLDVTDTAALDALAAKYRGQPIDVLINNAGILGDPDAQQLGRFDQKTFEDVMRVNAYAPLHSAVAIVRLIEELTPQQAEHAINYDGEQLPW